MSYGLRGAVTPAPDIGSYFGTLGNLWNLASTKSKVAIVGAAALVGWLVLGGSGRSGR